MSGESSYFSRFFVKFVEVSAAGLASAICAYLLAHFGGLLPAPAPATAVQVGSTASETPESRRAQPSPSVEQRSAPQRDTDAAVAQSALKSAPSQAPPVEQGSAPQRDTDAAVAQPALKSVKDAKAVAPRKRTKTDTSVTEKEPQQKSAEALARAALANIDANRPASPDAVTGPSLTDTPAPADIQSRRANVPPRQADVGLSQPVAAPPRAGGMEVAPHAADVQPQAEISPAPGANIQPGARDVRPHPVPPVDLQSRPVPAVDPRSPRADPPPEIGAPQQPPTADQDKGVFSALKRMPDLARPADPPTSTGETPRPPMPVGTTSNLK